MNGMEPIADPAEVDARRDRAREVAGSDGRADSASRRVPDDSRTDVGNARRFATKNRGEVFYCGGRGWFEWDGKRHRQVEVNGPIMRRAKDTVRAILVEAAEEPDPEVRKAKVKHALTSHGASRLDAMLKLAPSEPGVSIETSELDGDPWLLNCNNCTVDLRTMQPHPHRREDMISRLAPVDFDPHATCPTWDRFLSEVMDGNDRLTTYLQRLSGYALTGRTTEHVMAVLYGTGRNGKSTYIDTNATVLGDYWRKAAAETFLEAKRGANGPRDDLAELAGARLVTAVESGDGRRLAESLVKECTGGDPIRARFLYRDAFTFIPQFKVMLATNHRPVIRGMDPGIWSRIHLVPFAVFIPPERRDRGLADKLRAELPGILAWAIRGCLLWQRDGLQPPAEVLEATARYQTDMDPIAGFLTERCEVGQGLVVTSKELFGAYKAWCSTEGEEPMSQRAFGALLTDRGFQVAKIGHDRAKGRRGIALASDLRTQGTPDEELEYSQSGQGVAGITGTDADLAVPVSMESARPPYSQGDLLENGDRRVREAGLNGDTSRESLDNPCGPKAPACEFCGDRAEGTLPNGRLACENCAGPVNLMPLPTPGPESPDADIPDVQVPGTIRQGVPA